MSTENAPENETETGAAEPEKLDEAIDDLRDVLQQDAEGLDLSSMGAAEDGALDMGSDFGDDVNTEGDLSADFGGDFDVSTEPNADLGGSKFGGAGGVDASMNDFSGASTVTGATGSMSRADLVMDIPIDVQVVLGTSRMQVSALMDLSEGATIGLERKIGEPVEIMVNGKLIGRGEITVLENDDTRFGVKMIEIIGAKATTG